MRYAGEPLRECLCTGSKFCWALRQQHPFIHAWACMEIYARACIELPAWGTCLSAFFPVCALVSNCHHALQCVLSCASLYKYAVFMFSSSAHLIALTSWSLLGCFVFMPVYILAHYNPNAYFSTFGVIRPHLVSVALRVVHILGQKSDFLYPKVCLSSSCDACKRAFLLWASYCGLPGGPDFQWWTR